MNEPHLGSHYTDSGLPINVGDQVIVDEEHEGVIEKVILPETESARDYSCEKTGGLLIKDKQAGLMLLPFGFSHIITHKS
jgi:hypothetical protein